MSRHGHTTRWRQWLHRPQIVPFREWTFRIHLWAGIAAGIYIVAMSLTGGVLLFYAPAYRALTPRPVSPPSNSRPLDQVQLRAAIQRVHPGSLVNWIWLRQSPPGLAEVWLEDGGRERKDFVNIYTGADLGSADSLGLRLLNGVKNFHVTLLAGRFGKTLNGLGAVILTLLALTGMLIWWPGVSRWRRHLYIRPSTNWRRFNWEIHSAAGAWMFLAVLMWGVSGLAITWNVFHALPDSSVSRGLERWTYLLHFGSFGGEPARVIWALLALGPPLLFLTGVVMWMNRSPAGKRLTSPVRRPPEGRPPGLTFR